jgi:uncharacterized protein YbjT (DUF2867 family)
LKRIFISGGSGFIGQAILPLLLSAGHNVTALARVGSAKKLSEGTRVVIGDALDGSTFTCDGADTFIHLVGTAHPAPWKAAEFKAIDLRSLQASIEVARRASSVRHFIFLSVAQPAPIMRAYIEVRAECERIVEASGIPATFVRPWYVLGKGRSWPLALKPLYAMGELISSTREGARRLGLVTLDQIARAIVSAVDSPPEHTRILDVPAIKAGTVYGR